MKITRVTPKNGRWYYIEDLEERGPTGRPKQKWHPLSRIDEGDAELTKALSVLLGKAPDREGNLPAHLMEFRAVHLPSLEFQVRKEYERNYDKIAKAFKQFDSHEVEPGDIEAFLNRDFSTKINAKGKYKARLSTFFSWCVRNSHTGVKVNPCREIRLSGPPKRKGRMSASVYWAFYDKLTPMGQCFLELAYLTRQRPTEIRLLRESNIGPERIHFKPTKTKKSTGEEVDVLITPEIRACLERAKSVRPKVKVMAFDPFIIQDREGKGYSKNGLYEVWRNAADAIGIKGVTTRDIRPYALSVMEDMGYEVRDIQKAAAHASITTTEGYLNQHRDRLSDARLPLPQRPKNV
jgi:integrase